MEDWRNAPRLTPTKSRRRRVWLVQIRLKRRMTQAQVAQAVGISEQAYRRIEAGRNDGKQRTRRAIAKALDFPMEIWGRRLNRASGCGVRKLSQKTLERHKEYRLWLAEIRLSKGMTQEATAEAAYMTGGGYNKVETGRTQNPPPETKAAIARALGFPMERWEVEA